MANIFDGPLTSAALCWRIERADGAGVALTSHDREIGRDGVRYLPNPGVTPAAFTRSLGLEPDSGEISAALNSAAFTEQDLTLGRWNHASILLRALDWVAPEREAVDLLAGELGEVSVRGDEFSAELRGAATKLERPVCPSTSPECRAQLGDKQCRVDLAGRTVIATVLDEQQGELLLDRSVGDAFLLGRLRYLRGANCGTQSVVMSVAADRVRVRDLPRAPVELGCRIELREGCDKRLSSCVNRFDNAANFRGEPHLPGNDLLTRYPGA